MKEFDQKRIWGPTPRYPRVLDYKPVRADGPIILAGPCSIESPEQIEEVCKVLVDLPITYMRGGVFRAGTYPPKEFGLKRDLLFDWKDIAQEYGLKIIVEVLDVRELDTIDFEADAFQIGARHMQDYVLLKEIRQTKKHVTLKRHPGSTLDEFLGACEYLLEGNCKPILIERGSSTHMNHVRWDLSVSTIAAVKEICNVPIIVDASHGSGRSDLVVPLTLAGMGAGADGFLIETHPRPSESISDSEQAYPLREVWRVIQACKEIEKTRKAWKEEKLTKELLQ